MPEDRWGPLCKFLGKDITKGEHPRANGGEFVADLTIQSFGGCQVKLSRERWPCGYALCGRCGMGGISMMRQINILLVAYV